MSNTTHSRNVIENVIKHLDLLTQATSVKSVLEHNRQIGKFLQYDQESGLNNFFRLKSALHIKSLSKWDRVASILKTLENKSNQKEYVSVRPKVQGKKILVIGGGLSGLRVSIELLLMGAKVIIVEKRNEFSRNNVIHLWPNVINDMYSFEAKRFYGQFCVGSIDHISIRQLQLILLKIAIIYGVKFYPNTEFSEICPRSIEPRHHRCDKSCDCCCHVHGFGDGAYAHFSSASYSSTLMELTRQSFDVIIGCDGRRNTFSRYFPRNNRRGKLAIGLTANFVNNRTEEEAHAPEISGISKIYNQKWFKDLCDETEIELENLVYYRDETHYFVMTATKASLLKRGVLKSDYGDSHQLLHLDNIDTSKLMKYSKDAAQWSSKLERLEFARNSNNRPDVALFDFTSMYSATNASCAKKTYLKCCENFNVWESENYKYTLILLCGDSLLEPFWPTGSGAGRGFLSALDAAWTVGQWFVQTADDNSDVDAMLNVISKREYIYRLLAQTSPENTTSKNFTLDPQTRYKNLNFRNLKALQDIKLQVKHLIIDGNDLDVKNYLTSYETKRARRATVGIDPEDILKAKSLMQKEQEMNHHRNHHHHHQAPQATSRQYYARNTSYAEPQPQLDPRRKYTTIANNNDHPNCDNKPVEIVKFEPRNLIENDPGSVRHVAVEPRNNGTDYSTSNMAKRNYTARNHFFSSDENAAGTDSYPYTGRASSSDYRNAIRDRFYASQMATNNNNNDPGGTISSNNKENVPDFKRIFDFCIDDTFEKFSTDESEQNNNNDGDKKAFYGSNSFKNRVNLLSDLTQNPSSVSRLGKDEFEARINQRTRPKKSSDILEKAKHLEQKLEEPRKPFVPTLSRVGKIEENDWNVKMWNSSDTFAPKVEKRNYVTDNSKDLLQSRINQLSNNMEYRRNEKPNITPRITNDYVNLLQNEVTQKFSNSSMMSTSQIDSVTPRPSAFDELSRSTTSIESFGDSSKKDLLKPIGDCSRCNKTLIAAHRVTIGGRQYHKICLTCKMCSVMLRQDEVDLDFTCKICSRSRSGTFSDAKNAFMSSSLNLNIEAKKNFLVNVESVDLRERAEFEINDPEPNDDDEDDDGNQNGQDEEINDLNNDVGSSPDQEEEEEVEVEEPEPEPVKKEKFDFREPPQQDIDDAESSDLSENKSTYSSQITDDENSDSDSGDDVDADDDDDDEDSRSKTNTTTTTGTPNTSSNKNDDFGSGFTSLLGTATNTTTIDDSVEDSSRSINPNLTSETEPNSNNSASHCKLITDTATATAVVTASSSLDDDPREDEEEMAMYSKPVSLTSFIGASGSLEFDSVKNSRTSSNPILNGNDNKENHIDEHFGPNSISNDFRDFNVKPAFDNIQSSTPEQAPQEDGTLPRVAPVKPTYRYAGQFTEKLYRSMSQPSLLQQLKNTQDRLKERKMATGNDTRIRSQDLPFADGEDYLHRSPSTTSRRGRRPGSGIPQLTRAPFAKIDDV